MGHPGARGGIVAPDASVVTKKAALVEAKISELEESIGRRAA